MGGPHAGDTGVRAAGDGAAPAWRLSRLAAVNRLSFDDLDEAAHFYDDDPATADLLAALTGYPASALLRAIPELSHQQASSAAAQAGRCPTPREFINDIRPQAPEQARAQFLLLLAD